MLLSKYANDPKALRGIETMAEKYSPVELKEITDLGRNLWNGLWHKTRNELLNQVGFEVPWGYVDGDDSVHLALGLAFTAGAEKLIEATKKDDHAGL